MDIKKTITSLENLSQESLAFGEKFILIVEHKQINFEFFLNLKSTSDALLVLGSGAIDPKKHSLPVFHRHSWADEIACSSIFYNDPTLYLGNINIGWGQGDEEHFYLETISNIVIKIADILKIKPEKTTFYGSSAGGYTSLFLSGLFKGSTALVNNPQTIVYNYYQSHVLKMFEVSYKKKGLEDFPQHLRYRMNIPELYKKINYIPNIIYYQNLACEHDINRHFNPFIKDIFELTKQKPYVKKVECHFYYDEEKGHNPMSKEETLAILNERTGKY
ncbi:MULTISPECIES: glycosyl transferase family 2 [Bacillus]|nr:glycosyl transferase family 2 [Bacillus paralicheniformis]MBU8580624.1 glycosyl transferase family 2 [Bacillus paralicheniformis]MBZ5215645.1 glycosyl transferase family 2 [Bacillus paralicheniformis]MCQ5454257.1 glycosyl transferase family 2 [Bacillus paralicheniformis]MCY8149378.1 glycosyl transferase family 2 [Bacillus paralicheniformis]MCY8178368.1 glycosyl transferase family 2 [Bacillus paralicheniformis]